MERLVQMMDGSIVDISKIIAITDIFTLGELYNKNDYKNIPSFYTQVVFDIHFQNTCVTKSFYNDVPIVSAMRIILTKNIDYFHIKDDDEWLQNFKKCHPDYKLYADFVEYWKTYIKENV